MFTSTHYVMGVVTCAHVHEDLYPICTELRYRQSYGYATRCTMTVVDIVVTRVGGVYCEGDAGFFFCLDCGSHEKKPRRPNLARGRAQLTVCSPCGCQ